MNKFACAAGLAGVFAMSGFAGAASAQVLTLSTTNPGGLTHSIGSAIARTVSEQTDLRLVVVPAGGSPMPAVAGGEADCGINVGFDLSYYVNGTGFYEGQDQHPNLRMAAAVLDSQVALFVNQDADQTTVADLKGLRVPSGLNAQAAIGQVYDTYLSIGGMTRDDVDNIPAQSIVQAADDFSAGRNDTFLFSVGAAKVLEVDSSVGGLRALTVPDTDETRALLSEGLPGATFRTLEAGSSDQITAPTNVIAYDLVLFCADSVPEDAVQTITQVIHDHRDDMAATFKPMGRFDNAGMAPEVPGVDYHPGAIAALRDAGLWTGDN